MDESLRQRIISLLNLAKGNSNPHERHEATKAAQRLIKKHGLTLADLAPPPGQQTISATEILIAMLRYQRLQEELTARLRESELQRKKAIRNDLLFFSFMVIMLVVGVLVAVLKR